MPSAIVRAARFASLQARRVVQTPSAFENWPEVLRGIAASRVGRGPDTLTFHTRLGPSIEVPNVRGAFVPPYEVFAEDTYRLEWFLGERLRQPFHVLDIGAHVGAFACHLAALNPVVTIDCFEPAAGTVEYLRRNVIENSFEDRIEVHQAALADRIGTAIFEEHLPGSGLNRLGATGAGSPVPTTTFDEAVAKARGPVELVKMDCEGGEYDLVFASSPSSWTDVRGLLLEYHRVEGRTWPELRQWFSDEVGLRVVDEVVSDDPALGVAWLAR